MIKKIRWKLIVTISVCLLFLLLGQLFFQPTLQRFNHNVNKYTTMNMNKNEGVHHFVLFVIQKLNSLYPDLRTIYQGQITPYHDELPQPLANIIEPVVRVNSLRQLQQVLENLGDTKTIVFEPGIYTFSGRSIKLQHEGTEPVIMRVAEPENTQFIQMNQVAFAIKSANWVLSGFQFKGECAQDKDCEHAIHIVGDADNVSIISNDFTNYNAAIKSNGYSAKNTDLRQFPDNVSIKHNRFVNQHPRNTKKSVTPIDVVGGDNWQISHNFIADFVKQGGNRITYGAFLKGGGRYGKIHDNVVACKWKLPYGSVFDARVGLSLGGGGTGVKYCQSERCVYEHDKGIIKDNLVLNCTNEVALYINKSTNSLVTGNRLISTLGIDAKYTASLADYSNNQLHGNLRLDGSSEVQQRCANQQLWWFDDGVSVRHD